MNKYINQLSTKKGKSGNVNVNSLLTIFCIFLSSCGRFLDIAPPKDAASPDQAFDNDAIATSAVLGIYSRMAAYGPFSGDHTSIGVIAGLSSDEFISHNTGKEVFYINSLPANNLEIGSLWTTAYSLIYSCNAIIEKLNDVNGVTESTRRQLEGEARFMRAFLYFYLTNLFGEVPLNLNTDYRKNETASKATIESIYAQIISDLKDAEHLLDSKYITNERVRPNSWTAKALLSRVYLYTEQWELAIQKASEVISHGSTYSLIQNLDEVFQKNSMEAIWQLMPTEGNNTKEGNLFILFGLPNYVSLSPQFVASFNPEDDRKAKWIGEFASQENKFYYPFKYKIRASPVVSEYSMVMRLAELYLIRAEASANIQDNELALKDLNSIRARAGITTPLVGLTSSQCLAEVENQRRYELFSEWGHRWLDLKRTRRALDVLSNNNTKNITSTDLLYPIPESETERNPNTEQNPGY